MAMSFSSKVESALRPHRETYRELVNGWIAEGSFGFAYPALLVETYHYVKHSAALMSLACARLGRDHSPLQCYLAHHIAEEVGHEEWALEDLEVLGFSRSEVEGSSPLPETVHLIGSQLYIVNFEHPAGLIGYIYVMESTPPQEDSLEMIQGVYDIPRDAMKFLRGHGEADIHHREELREMLDHHFADLYLQQVTIRSAVQGLGDMNRLLLRLRQGRFVRAIPDTVASDAKKRRHSGIEDLVSPNSPIS